MTAAIFRYQGACWAVFQGLFSGAAAPTHALCARSQKGIPQADKTQSGGGRRLQHGRQHVENNRSAVGCPCSIAIVQQQNGARSADACNSACLTRSASPIRVSNPRADQLASVKPSRASTGIEKRIAQAGRGTKKHGALTGNLAEGALCGLQFAHEAARAQQGKMMAVVLAVVFHGMATADDFPA